MAPDTIIPDAGAADEGDTEALRQWIAMLEETAKIDPPEEQFELIGYLEPVGGLPVWLHDSPPAKDLDEIFAREGIDRHLVPSPDGSRAKVEDKGAGRGVLISADGRVFLERVDFVAKRVQEAAFAPDEDHSSGIEPGDDPDVAAYAPLDLLEDRPSDAWGNLDPRTSGERLPSGPSELSNPLVPRLDRIRGSDNRNPWTGTEWPRRAMGISMLRDLGINGMVRYGASGVAIGPRQILTVAHVVSPNGRDWIPLAAAPAARGTTWSTDSAPMQEGTSNSKFPFGARRIQWYYWPSGWTGSENQYDYSVLIMWDLCWSPGWVSFGYASTTSLDYTSVDLIGTPAGWKDCANSPDADGECGWYIYEQLNGATRAVTTNLIYHWLDVQEGQSGAPINFGSQASPRIRGLHRGSSGSYGWGFRIRSGSYSTICSWMNNWTSSCWSNPSC